MGKTVKLLVDGVPYDFPQELKSIVVSNVQSFASGVQLWKDKRGRFGPPQLNDGLLEIQGVFGTWHMRLHANQVAQRNKNSARVFRHFRH